MKKLLLTLALLLAPLALQAAEIRIVIEHMPEGTDSKEVSMSGLTDEQAELSTPLIRYWMSQDRQWVIIVAPIFTPATTTTQ